MNFSTHKNETYDTSYSSQQLKRMIDQESARRKATAEGQMRFMGGPSAVFGKSHVELMGMYNEALRREETERRINELEMKNAELEHCRCDKCTDNE